jgi:hypothetical protein
MAAGPSILTIVTNNGTSQNLVTSDQLVVATKVANILADGEGYFRVSPEYCKVQIHQGVIDKYKDALDAGTITVQDLIDFAQYVPKYADKILKVSSVLQTAVVTQFSA